jgi:hypothetical protein
MFVDFLPFSFRFDRVRRFVVVVSGAKRCGTSSNVTLAARVARPATRSVNRTDTFLTAISGCVGPCCRGVPGHVALAFRAMNPWLDDHRLETTTVVASSAAPQHAKMRLPVKQQALGPGRVVSVIS